MLGLACANLIITDKRSDGYLEKHSWGLDFPMSDLDRTQRVAGLLQNAAMQKPEWALTNIHPLPELNAAILSCHAGSINMSLDDWIQEQSNYWKLTQPPGRDHYWIKFYDARENQTGSLLSRFRWAKNPTWRLTFLRSQPPYFQTDPIYWAITLNALGSIRYRLTLEQSGSVYPTLEKSTDGGVSWVLVDNLCRDDAAAWADAAFERCDYLYCRFIPDHLIFSLGDSASHWIYHEDDLEIPEGEVRIECGGGAFAFHAKLSQYMPSGTITERVSVSSAGEQVNSGSWYLAISAQGRFVAFSYLASNLVPGDTNGCSDFFVHDRLTGVTERVSVSSEGQQANMDCWYESAISADGRFVAFMSEASNLVPGDTNSSYDVFVHDRQTGAASRGR